MSNVRVKDRFKVQGLVCAILLVLLGCSNRTENRVTVCSKNFTEQLILGELLAQQIETETDLSVTRRSNLAGELCHQALVAGEVDVYVEYTGTAFANILKYDPITDPQQVYQKVKQDYAEKYNLDWLTPLGFNNTFAIVVRGEDAQQLKLKTISDVAAVAPEWRAGFGYEFVEREDGFPGLAATYNLKFAEPPKTMDLGLIYRALEQQQVDLVAGNSTDGLIDSLNLVVLEDDQQYFPPYEAVPVIRQEALEKYPQLRPVLEALGNKISEDEIRKLNYQVDGEKQEIESVVEQSLSRLKE